MVDFYTILLLYFTQITKRQTEKFHSPCVISSHLPLQSINFLVSPLRSHKKVEGPKALRTKRRHIISLLSSPLPPNQKLWFPILVMLYLSAYQLRAFISYRTANPLVRMKRHGYNIGEDVPGPRFCKWSAFILPRIPFFHKRRYPKWYFIIIP